jgi:hypothetical protein
MMASNSDSLEDLTSFLAAGGPRELDPDEIARRLSLVWDDLAGSTDHAMRRDKLVRIESAEWDPPLMRFDIERHGATVGGSIYGEVQHWAVNLVDMTAEMVSSTKRRLHAASKPLDVQPMAEQVAKLMTDGADSDLLEWSRDRKSVRVLSGRVIPSSGPQQTVAARRKRFAGALSEILTPEGWSPSAQPGRWERRTE